MPTSTAITASSGMSSLSTSNTSAGCRRPWASTRSRRDAFSARQRCHRVGDLLRGWRVGRPAGSAGHAARRWCGRCRPTAAPRPGGTCRGSCGRGRPGWSAPTSGSTCGWRTTRPARAGSRPGRRSGWRPGCPERPRTPQPSGWSSGKVPLALNVEITGASRCSASAMTASRWGRAPLPTTMAGRSAARSSSTARASSSAGGAMAVAASRPARGRGGGSSRPGSSWTSSGSTRWATSRWTMACFMASAASSVALAGDEDRLAPLGHRRRTPSRAAAPGRCPAR